MKSIWDNGFFKRWIVCTEPRQMYHKLVNRCNHQKYHAVKKEIWWSARIDVKSCRWLSAFWRKVTVFAFNPEDGRDTFLRSAGDYRRHNPQGHNRLYRIFNSHFHSSEITVSCKLSPLTSDIIGSSGIRLDKGQEIFSEYSTQFRFLLM